MRVSQKSEYALRAMLELALRRDHGQSMRSGDIAKNQRIPEKFLELILVELRRAGFVKSQRGPVGGHRLARAPQNISVGEIWRTIDGSTTEHGQSGLADPFRPVWQEVDKAISGVVDHISLADMCKRAEARVGVPEYDI